MKIRYSILTALFLLCFNLIVAQIEVANDGVLFISDGQLVHLQGNLTNRSSLFFNRGDFCLTGNLTNNAQVFDMSTGIFRLLGTGTQTLTLNQTFNVYDVEIDNASGARIIGSSNLEIYGLMNFWNGIIHTSKDALVRFYNLGNHINADDFSHISGPVQKVGIDNFILPTGKGGLYKPAGLYDITENNIFQGEYFDYGFGNYETDYSLKNVSKKEYWEIVRLAGMGNARLSLAYDGLTSSFPDEHNIDIAFWSEAFWTQVKAEPDGSAPVSEIISQDLVTNFGFFTLAERELIPENVEPLQFDVFQDEDCQTILTWILPEGSAITEFEIERSFDSLNYVNIGYVAGDTLPLEEIKVYWFTDAQLHKSDRLYYRLKIKYPTGAFSYSPVRGIENDCPFLDCLLFPNPVLSGRDMKLRMETDEDQTITVDIYDIPGHLIGRQTFDIFAGKADYPIKVGKMDLPAATYFLKVNKRKTLKFVVIRD